MRFIAIDLDIADPQMSSICQIGMVPFEAGRERTLVRYTGKAPLRYLGVFKTSKSNCKI